MVKLGNLGSRGAESYLLAAILITVSMAGFAFGATYTVDGGGSGNYLTIQGAISDPYVVNGDEIIVAAGTYYENIDFLGKAITVRSTYTINPANTIISGMGIPGSGTVVTFQTNEDATSVLRGFTIQGGWNDFGGGVSCLGTSPTIIDCIITSNNADYDGGGIDCYDGSPVIKNCIISGNSAVDFGAGIECYNASPTISNCLIKENSSGQAGGAIDCYDSTATITNCTIVYNSSGLSFGGIYADSSSSATAVTNCILQGNGIDITGGSVTYSCFEGAAGTGNIDSADPLLRTGPLGDYYLSQTTAAQIYDSPCVDAGDSTALALGLDVYTTRTDSIGDSGTVDMGYHYPDSGAYVDYELVSEVVGGNGSIDPCTPNPLTPLIYKEFAEVLFTATPDTGYNVNSWSGTDDDLSQATTNITTITGNTTVNVQFAPKAVYNLTTVVIDNIGGTIMPAGTTPYHEGDVVLLETAAEPGYIVKQWTGTDDDASIGPNNYVTILHDTTVTVEFITALVNLNVRVVDTGSGTNGTVAPRRDDYPFNSVVSITATPDSGYLVKQWMGTDDDTLKTVTNTVTMDSDKIVNVEFIFDAPRDLLVPSVYDTIELAVADASEGDTIVLAVSGIEPYLINDPCGIKFGGKKITIRSTNPDDPCCIANTIIDCKGDKSRAKRAFYFRHGEAPSTSIIWGITIRNGFMGNIGPSAIDPNAPWPPLDPLPDPPPPNRANTGRSAAGDGYGGAILCENNSSPTIKNCVFTNCTVTGGIGGDGGYGYYIPRDWEGVPGQSGGHGGSGSGDGYGGAIACVGNSSPHIINCTFTDNVATGGWGGEGGDGSQRGLNTTGQESWGGDGGDGEGDGKGGAIYFEDHCSPVIMDCVFENNRAIAAIAGSGGAAGPGDTAWPDPWNDPGAQDGMDGVAGTHGAVVGGAIFCDHDSTLLFENCSFNGNAAHTPLYYDAVGSSRSGSYTEGGALYIGDNSDLNVVDCEFTESGAGAIYVDHHTHITITDCNFVDNFNYDEYDPIDLDIFGNPDPLSGLQMHLAPGGAIFLGLDSDADIKGTGFFNNRTYGVGGAINSKGNLTIEGSLFTSNHAIGDGGAIDSHIYSGGLTTMQIVDCIFVGNESGRSGGVVCANGFEAYFDGCYLFGNIAQSGGAFHFANGLADIDGGLIRENHATGILLDNVPTFDESLGGGIVCISTTLTVQDCTIEENTVTGENALGGAISIYGGGGIIGHSIKNCLIQGNTSDAFGGGIACSVGVTPQIENCTFSGNSATEGGGGIFCDWSSDAQVSNSIFNASSGFAVYEEQLDGDSSALNCLFYGNLPGDYYDAATGSDYTGALQINSIAGNSGNLDSDPLFVPGPLDNFYLDQDLSPAIDAGNNTAVALGLDSLTTDPKGVFDANDVDLGYHHDPAASSFEYTFILTAQVHVDGHGSFELDPVTVGNSYPAGTMVKITAIPDSGFRVASWSGGTINDSSKDWVNYVIMSSDKTITIEYEQTATLVVGYGENTSIIRTIELAEEGDTVIIPAGEWIPSRPFEQITIFGKNITIIGDDPENPENTVLRDYSFFLVRLGAETVIEGITLTNNSKIFMLSCDVTIRNCVFRDTMWGKWYGGDGLGCSDGPSDGGNGKGEYGGALEMFDSSPTVSNCSFDRISLTAGDGGRGSEGCCDTHGWGWDGGWAGRAYGGAVYCAFYSSPTFLDCTFTDCFAQGGSGGDGGVGVTCDQVQHHGGRGGSWEWSDDIENDRNIWWWWRDGWRWGDKYGSHGWYLGFDLHGPYWQDPLAHDTEYENSPVSFELINYPFILLVIFGFDFYDIEPYDPFDAYYDYWEYSGYGGAVFMEDHSNPKFTGCTFTNNRSFGGVSGIGGDGSNEWYHQWPDRNLDIDTAGGAVFGRELCNPEFTDCVFTGNSSDTSIVEEPEDYYVSFGGGLAFENNCFPKFTNCQISENSAALGGGIFWTDSEADIIDCNIFDNYAYSGGGLYSSYSKGTVVALDLTGNTAATFAPEGEIIDPNAFGLRSIKGQGGGFYCFSSIVDIADSLFTANSATDSGGGLYLGGSDGDMTDQPTVRNSLFTENTAGHDGGGITIDWLCQPKISNCTITRNTTMGMDSLGGGLFVSYESYVDVIDSIIWANNAASGAQIAVTVTPDGRSSTLNITYSDIGPACDPNNTLLPEWAQTQSSDPFVGQDQATGIAVLMDGQTIYDEFDTGAETVKVIVSLIEPTLLKQEIDWSSAQSLDLLRTEVSVRQDQVLSTLTFTEFTIRYRYENQAGFSGEITTVGLNKLLANPSVAYIEPVRTVYPALAQGLPLMNAASSRTSYNGQGVAIAICDTGVDYTHPMLGGGGFPNDKVIGGYDFGEMDADPMPGGISFSTSHGTACAGIAAGDFGEVEDYIGGVAPEAKIYALKMSPDNSDGAAIDAMIATWDWCVTHKNDDPDNPIMVTSTSFGAGRFFSSEEADNASPAMTTAANNANAIGITVLASSGNDYFTDSMGWPAAISSVISVGAVYDDAFISLYCGIQTQPDEVTCYSNTADFLDVLAPSENAYTTDIVGIPGYNSGDYYPFFSGTSAACPYAAGAVVAMQHAAMEQRNAYLRPDEVRTLLTTTGDPVTDTKVDITKPRVNVGAAIASITYGPPIYIEDGGILNGDVIYDFDPNAFTWDPCTHNIDENPLFIGDFFLSQYLAGQLTQSPCVDAGSDLAANVSLDTYTTRTDGVTEADTDPNVDMGYHRRQFTPAQYLLTTSIEASDTNVSLEPDIPDGAYYYQYTQVELVVTGDDIPDGYRLGWTGTDDDDAHEMTNVVTMDADKTVHVEVEKYICVLDAEVIGEHGTIELLTDAFDPNDPGTLTKRIYEVGTVVDVIVYPDEGYRVKEWLGADNMPAIGLKTNIVTITPGDGVVAVEFELPTTIKVPGDADTIQEAVGLANAGDIVEVLPGTYMGGYIIIDKEITLRGTNPDDSSVVADTVIDGEGYARPCVIFLPGAGEGAILNGITIANGRRTVLPGEDGEQPTDADPGNNPNGEDGGNVPGGGIYCFDGSSPTILNCIVRNCITAGGLAGNGAAATATQNAGRGGWGGWGRGGGVYIEGGASPVFKNVTIRNNAATGGNGGNGGNYVEDGGYAGIGGLWSNDFYAPWWLMLGSYGMMYEGDYRYYSGYGGGVYCAEDSSATFIGCTITENRTRGGMSGIGGDTPGRREDPPFSYEIPSYGGGVYCAKNSVVRFFDCTITNNVSPKPQYDPDTIEEITEPVEDGDDVVVGITGTPIYHLDPYLGHGGGVAFEETSSVTFENCIISDNEASCGGGLFMANDNLNLVDCEISGNEAYQGGAMYATHGAATIAGGNFVGNFAGSIQGWDVDEIAGQGGAIYCASTEADIFDCNITGNEATASGGGIFLTGGDANSPSVKNCLLAFNKSGRDGGGISVNWHSSPTISNCTIFENRVTGLFSEAGLGGGLYASYHSNSILIDSILWNNTADSGRQIAVATGFEFDPRPATLTVSHCDIQGGKADTASFVDSGCTLTWLDGIINDDPLFVTGPQGDYYLSQISAGQTTNSPCVDTGSAFAGDVGMHEYVTRNDDAYAAYDNGIVDMGYHYPPPIPLEPCRFCDFLLDGIVTIGDLEILANHWLDDCGSVDCEGSSLTADNTVDLIDFAIFADCWLVEDNDPPEPNPAQWQLLPYTEPGSTGISMMAKIAKDTWSETVYYQFECIDGTPQHTSPWQTDPCWVDTGLVLENSYTYVVRVRDVWDVPNITEDSVEASATAGEEWGVPVPDPARFATIAEDAFNGAPKPDGDSAIIMTAATATDPEGSGIEYKFFCATDGNFDSDWQSSPTYGVTGLTIATEYCFFVVVRDTSSNNNETAQSDTLCSLPGTPNYAPYPTGGAIDDAAMFDTLPYQWDSFPEDWHIMSAIVAVDAEGDAIEYFFEARDGGTSSGWQASPNYEYEIGSQTPLNYDYRVKYRDNQGNESPYSAWYDVLIIP